MLAQRVATLARPGGRPQGRPVRAAAKRQRPPKPQKAKRKRRPIDQRIDMGYGPEDDWEEEDVAVVVTSRVPSAPSPSDTREPELRPQDLYPVFAPPPPAVARAGGSRPGADGKWSWDDPAEPAGGEEAVPLWNPRTGFMRTRTQVEAAEAAASAAAASAAATGAPAAADAGMAGSAGASGRLAADGSGERAQASRQPAAAAPAAGPGADAPGSSSAAPATEGAGGAQAVPLPAASRAQVLGSCLSTGAGFLLLAAVVRAYADQGGGAAVLHVDPQAVQRLLRVPPGLDSLEQAGVMLGAAGAVTGARLALMGAWPAFREATERSNAQVLGPLGWADVALVAAASGVPEELLFRGALIPASFPDARGVLLAGALFGVLHNSGGRNPAFAAWAAGVGCLYGAAFLYTGNLWVAAGAHALANFASAAAWKARTAGAAAGAGAPPNGGGSAGGGR